MSSWPLPSVPRTRISTLPLWRCNRTQAVRNWRLFLWLYLQSVLSKRTFVKFTYIFFRRKLSCGNHSCTSVCHAGSCSRCDMSPQQVSTCPCGSKSIVGLRQSCLDPIITCKNVCNKVCLYWSVNYSYLFTSCFHARSTDVRVPATLEIAVPALKLLMWCAAVGQHLVQCRAARRSDWVQMR